MSTKGKTCWKSIIDAENLTLTVKYLSQDGEIVSETTRAISDFQPEMVNLLALHGWKQRTQDSSAGFKDVAADLGWDNALLWAKDNHDAVYDQQVAGEWTARGEGRRVVVTILMEAVSRVYGQDINTTVAKIYPMPKEDKAKLAANPTIAKAMLEVKAERAAKKAELAKAKALDEGDLPDLFEVEDQEEEEEVA